MADARNDPRIPALAQRLRDRSGARTDCLDTLRRFSGLLFAEVQHALEALHAQNANVKTDLATKALGEGLQSAAFELEGRRIILAPVASAIDPNPRTETLPKPLREAPEV